LVSGGGCGYDAVAHGDVFVLAFDEPCLFGYGGCEVYDLESAYEECLVAVLGFFFSYFLADGLDGFAYDYSGEYGFFALDEFAEFSGCFLSGFCVC